MIVICEKCGEEYDDVYRWTFCPHEHFEMATTVVGPDGKIRGIARSVDELRQLMEA